jgi:multidrug efflux pump
MVLGGAEYAQLAAWRDELMEAAEGLGGLRGLDSDYQERQPQMRVVVDRNRAAELGVSLENVGRTLETMLGSRAVTTYIDRGREYNVILQGEAEGRATPSDLSNIYVRSETSGRLVPLSNLVSIAERAGPGRAAGASTGCARSPSTPGSSPAPRSARRSTSSRTGALEILPPDIRISWDGESREFKESGGSLYVTFVMALIVVFLVLAAQFESFRHPLVIMFTVPLAITGALLGLWAYGASINVYSQIGLIMLVGLAAKNGVLIVEFANQLRDRGMEFNEGGHRGVRDPAPAGAHDQRLHRHRRPAAAARLRRGLREPPGGGHRGGVRHDPDDIPYTVRGARGVFGHCAEYLYIREGGPSAKSWTFSGLCDWHASCTSTVNGRFF